MTNNKLTIIVKENNNLIKDAKITINPGNISATTDINGQFIFSLPLDQKKINIQVESNNFSQEVPYYPNNESNQQLEINLTYLKQIKLQEVNNSVQNNPQKTNQLPPFLITIFMLIIFIIIFISLIKKQKN